jgi:hypothetical protein
VPINRLTDLSPGRRRWSSGRDDIREGFVGAVLEPDIAHHNRIAGHDVAFVGGAIADHPIEPSAKPAVPIASVIAPASINDFIASRLAC